MEHMINDNELTYSHKGTGKIIFGIVFAIIATIFLITQIAVFDSSVMFIAFATFFLFIGIVMIVRAKSREILINRVGLSYKSERSILLKSEKREEFDAKQAIALGYTNWRTTSRDKSGNSSYFYYGKITLYFNEADIPYNENSFTESMNRSKMSDFHIYTSHDYMKPVDVMDSSQNVTSATKINNYPYLEEAQEIAEFLDIPVIELTKQTN